MPEAGWYETHGCYKKGQVPVLGDGTCEEDIPCIRTRISDGRMTAHLWKEQGVGVANRVLEKVGFQRGMSENRVASRIRSVKSKERPCF